VKLLRLRGREGGYGAGEIIGGAFLISFFFSACYFGTMWMRSVKAERRRTSHPNRQHYEHKVKEIKPGPEFGSYIITFEL